MKDSDNGLYRYANDYFFLLYKYEKAYWFKDGKAVVCENSVYNLIDIQGNVLSNDITSNIDLLSNENNYIQDCFGDYMIIKKAHYSKTGDSNISYYSQRVYDCTQEKFIWEIDNFRFTQNGDILRCDENCIGIVIDGNNNLVANFDLFSRKNRDFEKTAFVYLYKE